MSAPGVAFVFPAFASDYKEDQTNLIQGYTELLRDLLRKASDQVNAPLYRFDPLTKNFLDHELFNQYISFIQSCTCSILLRRSKLNPGMVAGYSMGIYASLFDSGSITLETGLELIRNAYHEIENITKDQNFSMGSVIGLSSDDIHQLIDHIDPDTEISNRNGPFSFVLSGRVSSLEGIIAKSKEEGAIHTHMFTVHQPYHSGFLKGTEPGFSSFVNQVHVNKPITPVISVIDQKELTSPEQVRQELVRNLFQPLDWYQTHLKLTDLGNTVFIEGSPLNTLSKIARFIPGNVKYYSPLNALNSLLFPDF